MIVRDIDITDESVLGQPVRAVNYQAFGTIQYFDAEDVARAWASTMDGPEYGLIDVFMDARTMRWHVIQYVRLALPQTDWKG